MKMESTDDTNPKKTPEKPRKEYAKKFKGSRWIRNFIIGEFDETQYHKTKDQLDQEQRLFEDFRYKLYCSTTTQINREFENFQDALFCEYHQLDEDTISANNNANDNIRQHPSDKSLITQFKNSHFIKLHGNQLATDPSQLVINFIINVADMVNDKTGTFQEFSNNQFVNIFLNAKLAYLDLHYTFLVDFYTKYNNKNIKDTYKLPKQLQAYYNRILNNPDNQLKVLASLQFFDFSFEISKTTTDYYTQALIHLYQRKLEPFTPFQKFERPSIDLKLIWTGRINELGFYFKELTNSEFLFPPKSLKKFAQLLDGLFYYETEGNTFNIDNLAKELSSNNTYNPGMYEMPTRKSKSKFDFDHQQAIQQLLWLGTVEERAAFFRELFDKGYANEVKDHSLAEVLSAKFAISEKEQNKIKTHNKGKTASGNANDLSKTIKYNLPISSKVE